MYNIQVYYETDIYIIIIIIMNMDVFATGTTDNFADRVRVTAKQLI